MKDDYLDIPFSRPYKLTESSIDRIRVSLAKAINCRVEEIRASYDKNKGYYFYGPYDICVADLLIEGAEYRGVQIYGGIVEDLKVQLEEERKRVEIETRQREARERRERQEQLRREQRAKRRRYVLQKYVVPAVAITAGGIVVLTGIGAIHNAITKEPTAIVQQQSLNTVANANDLVLFAWANHAMGEVSDIARESEYEHIQHMAENIRADYFTPTMSTYYSYVEEGMLDLPVELTGDSIKTNHNSFRNNAYLLDEELQNRGFGKCSFANSPYANAIVIDAYGRVVTAGGDGLFGEVYDSNGELITLESEMGYIIYIRAQDVVGNDYGTDNFPKDSIMYNGVPYVNSIHLHDFEAPTMGSK